MKHRSHIHKKFIRENEQRHQDEKNELLNPVDAVQRMRKSVQRFREQMDFIRGVTVDVGFLSALTFHHQGTHLSLDKSCLFKPNIGFIDVQPHEREHRPSIEKVISGAGLQCYSLDKNTLRVTVPIAGEAVKETIEQRVHKLGEETRIAIRNIRKQAKQGLHSRNKMAAILLSEEDVAKAERDIQQATDAQIAEIDRLVEVKIKALWRK